MNFTRRETLAVGAGAALAAALPGVVFAAGEAEIEAFTGGASVGAGGVTLTAPEIAENGNTVPIEVDAPGATEILVLALGNPTPPVAQFKFGANPVISPPRPGFALLAHRMWSPLPRWPMAASCRTARP